MLLLRCSARWCLCLFLQKANVLAATNLNSLTPVSGAIDASSGNTTLGNAQTTSIDLSVNYAGYKMDNGALTLVDYDLHGGVQSSLRFNGDLVSDGTPKGTFELKTGLQGEIARN